MTLIKLTTFIISFKLDKDLVTLQRSNHVHETLTMTRRNDICVRMWLSLLNFEYDII